ncbi:MAG TPA: exodeoxyribonuclease V subunit alpha, partial [Baekduia sp.]|nr:exodeoxyribonuclease V subunit alpha [Baekduia sp.]
RALDGVTLHRLLGSRPGSRRRFRHDRANRLAHDVVVVDETSMVSLELMARLLEAVRPGARLVLVGDPGQLASVEAGAVLGDVVGPPSATGPLAEGVVVLDRVHRYGEAIGRVAEAVRGGHADAVIEALRDGAPAVTWHDVDAADPAGAAAIRPAVVGAGAEVVEAARRGDARAALAALGATRVLCAHRRGPYGVSAWAAAVERWLADELDDFRPGVARWYAGRPVLITENDHELRLSNGDAGVAVVTGGRLRIAFERRDGVLLVGPARLQAAESVHAMTIHKSQGSQVGTAVVVLPDPSSRILTRELLYTAVTRAQDRLVLVGPEETIRAAVQRPVARASGLRERLWDVPGARA